MREAFLVGAAAEPAHSLCRVGSDLDHISHLARESARFAAAVAEAAPAASVPTCPEWDASAAPQDRVWTWSSDHTVGFVRRRQAHEALIHRIDAELTIGSRTPMDAQLSDDGIDEALRVMYGHVPDWATPSPNDSGVIRLRASDTPSTWLVCPGRLTGTDPGDGTTLDKAYLDVPDDSGPEGEATLTGSAADLDCWLWHRPTIAKLERAGDHRLLDQLEAVIQPGSPESTDTDRVILISVDGATGLRRPAMATFLVTGRRSATGTAEDRWATTTPVRHRSRRLQPCG